MTYKRFEDLPVWNDAVALVVSIFEWTGSSSFKKRGDIANQIQRAGLSISNNIAEGFERGTTNELLHFLYIARGSAGEVRSILHVLKRMGYEVGSRLKDVEDISRQLSGWAKSLQDSTIKGQKHLNSKSKLSYDQTQRSNEFWEKIQSYTPPIGGKPAGGKSDGKSAGTGGVA